MKPTMDSTIAKKITISGFCLCQTTLTDLQNLTNDFKLVDVEEMDFPKNCYGQDTRFTNGKGYFSKHYPDLIFQKKDSSDLINKIRLTKGFKGTLPNGSYIDLKKLKLKDVFLIYPEFKNKWGLKECSDYWRFSNDTIAFYVRINKKIQPLFPVDEAYYLDKPVEAIELVISCHSFIMKDNIKERTKDPIIFIDSIRANREDISKLSPKEVCGFSVLDETDGNKIAGPEGKSGVIYVTSKSFARSKYWAYLIAKSLDYLNAVPTNGNEPNVVYIINNKIYLNNYEDKLLKLNDTNFIEMKVIDEKQLNNIFNIKDKKWGIIIKTK